MTQVSNPDTQDEDGKDEDAQDLYSLQDDLSHWICTCQQVGPSAEDHHQDCQLQQCWDFTERWVTWDEQSFELVDIFPSTWTNSETNLDNLDNAEGALGGTKNWLDDWTQASAGLSKSPPPALKPVVKKCRHYQQAYALPNGSNVYASSHHRDREDDPIPDLGIYMDGIWTPDTLAFYVGCPDYGIPKPSVGNVIHVAREGIRLADAGQRVEVGCIGGHGRTGLMLAIMTVLTMEKPNGKEAVELVRSKYCRCAVESEDQEWYVEGIAAEILGVPWPDKPYRAPTKVYTTPTVATPPKVTKTVLKTDPKKVTDTKNTKKNKKAKNTKSQPDWFSFRNPAFQTQPKGK